MVAYSSLESLESFDTVQRLLFCEYKPSHRYQHEFEEDSFPADAYIVGRVWWLMPAYSVL